MRENTFSLVQSIKWLVADTETPISVFMRQIENREGILLESAEVDGRWGRFSLLATDMLFYISCMDGKLALDIRHSLFKPLNELGGLPFMQGLRDLMAKIDLAGPALNTPLPPITRALYGYLGFGMAAVFNPSLQDSLPLAEAECCLAFPATVLVFDHLYNRLCRLELKDKSTGKEIRPERNSTEVSYVPSDIDENQIESNPGEDGYKNFVVDIRERLHQGEAIQIVPSCRFSMPFTGDPFQLYRRMRMKNASPYMFYMRFPGITLFGSSPEVMVRCTANRLQLSPIAGTRRRGQNTQEDIELAEELLTDPKERAEHVMLVDLGRNDLGRIASTGSVVVEKSMEVERFSHVMHMTSSISAILDTDRKFDALDVLAATFPAGTVSGAPKIRAMQIIRELEGSPRGPYAGCIGWIGLDKNDVNLDMGITIRSMWVKDGRLFWQTGGGIVHDSDPALEWKEVCNKSGIMRQALKAEDGTYVPADR